MKRAAVPCLGLVVLLAAAASGCFFSPEDPKEDPSSPVVTLPFPDTPDQLIANFKTAYTGLDIGY